jgi:hypothetical protein
MNWGPFKDVIAEVLKGVLREKPKKAKAKGKA